MRELDFNELAALLRQVEIKDKPKILNIMRKMKGVTTIDLLRVAVISGLYSAIVRDDSGIHNLLLGSELLILYSIEAALGQPESNSGEPYTPRDVVKGDRYLLRRVNSVPERQKLLVLLSILSQGESFSELSMELARTCEVDGRKIIAEIIDYSFNTDDCDFDILNNMLLAFLRSEEIPDGIKFTLCGQCFSRIVGHENDGAPFSVTFLDKIPESEKDLFWKALIEGNVDDEALIDSPWFSVFVAPAVLMGASDAYPKMKDSVILALEFFLLKEKECTI